MVKTCLLHLVFYHLKPLSPRNTWAKTKKKKTVRTKTEKKDCHTECVFLGCRFKNLAQRKERQVANVASFRGMSPPLEPHHPTLVQHMQSPHQHQVM